jgi:hypothetical protein
MTFLVRAIPEGFIRAIAFLIIVSLAPAGSQEAFGQKRVYSYVDANGVRVLTNIPPKDSPVMDQEPGDRSQPVALPSSPESRTGKGNSAAEAAMKRNRLGNGGIGIPSGSPDPDSPLLKAPVASRYDPIIEKYAGEYRLDPSLVRSIIATESAFNPRAISNKGARGLMQLMPATASRVGVRNITDPEENIRGGMKHLRSLLDTFDNDLILSLAAYNAGENLVQRIQRIPNYPETHAYVRKVTQRYGKKEMAQTESLGPAWPRTFRYVDDLGVTHFTNIAPTQAVESDQTLSSTIGGQPRQ